MKAIILSQLGSINNLKYGNVPRPIPKKGKALIKVYFCGLNHLDLLTVTGKRIGPKKFPHILGSEVVGKIAKINESGKFKIGEQVAVYPWIFCGKCQQCQKGRENICDLGGTIGRTTWGGYAQYVSVPVKNLVKIPVGVKISDVCALTLAGITAYHLIQRAKVKRKSKVLITGATGGVGTVALQLLKNLNCSVICTTSHEEKSKKLKHLGADHVVFTKNIILEVKKLYPDGLEYVIDIIGGQVWSMAVEILAKNGTMVFCSTTLEEAGRVNIASAFFRQVNIFGSYGGTKKDLVAIMNLLRKGSIKPVIDSVYPLDKAQTALKRMENQKLFGKILLTPTD